MENFQQILPQILSKDAEMHIKDTINLFEGWIKKENVLQHRLKRK